MSRKSANNKSSTCCVYLGAERKERLQLRAKALGFANFSEYLCLIADAVGGLDRVQLADLTKTMGTKATAARGKV